MMSSLNSNSDPVRRPAPASLAELRVRAEALRGYSIGDLAGALGLEVPEDNRRSKGFIGQLIERALGADPKAGPRPDFVDLGVELKTIPVNDQGRPTETTFCCSIKMAQADQELWESSRLRLRLQRVLWVPVESARKRELAQRRIGSPVLWSPDAVAEAALRSDWEDLMGAIGSGRGGTLTAREGRVLHVRPKAANASVRTIAPGAGGPQKTLPLGFYLRTAFTAALLAGGSNVGLAGAAGEE
ncbi:MAG: DNA mismatch repair endonuclease MutH [Myxococcota bacterium]|nr:DNA mismatch repair endonuclease MutH [Myxococcota bacterium]